MKVHSISTHHLKDISISNNIEFPTQHYQVAIS